MNKRDFIQLYAEKNDTTTDVASDIIENMLVCIVLATSQQKQLRLAGFGEFYLHTRRPREPQETEYPIEFKFRASPDLPDTFWKVWDP